MVTQISEIKVSVEPQESQHLNTNNPELHFNDGDINSVMFNLLHRESDNMTRLCSGTPTRHPDQDKNLRCRLINKGSDPYLRLGPFLLEELNKAPYIGLVHRFLGEEEAVQVVHPYQALVGEEGVVPLQV